MVNKDREKSSCASTKELVELIDLEEYVNVCNRFYISCNNIQMSIDEGFVCLLKHDKLYSRRID